MPILRLAYVALFLIALIAVFTVWGQVGGVDHVDLLPWYVKLGLGGGAAYASVRAAAAAAEGKRAWSARTVKWFALLLALLAGCALATYYAHLYLEQDEEQPDESVTSESYSYNSPGLQNARRLAQPDPTSAATIRSRS